MLLLHGAGRSLVDWTGVADLLRTHHRVVAFDLRGHGGSSTCSTWDWHVALDDVQAVVDRHRLQRPAVVGHSLGGMVAAMWGRHHPEAAAVVNLDGHGPGRPELVDGLPPHTAAEQARQYRALAEAAMASAAPPLGALLRDVLRAATEVDLLAVYRACRTRLLVLNATASGVDVPDPPDWLASYLSAYRRGLSRALRSVASSTPGVVAVDLPLTHMCIVEQPHAIAQLLRDFLQVRAAPGHRPHTVHQDKAEQ